MPHARLFDHDECRRLRRTWKLDDLAKRYGVSRPAICKVCKGVVPTIEHRGGNVSEFRKVLIARRRQREAEARSMWREGREPEDIARLLGVVVSRVYHYTRGLERHRRPRKPINVNVIVPTWVFDADLVEDYLDFARDFGEQHAARECRRLKAEAAR